MNKDIRSNLILTILLFAVFAVFTGLVKTVDVLPIGPEGTEIGFATLNGAFAQAVGFHNFWYKLTEILGYVSLLVAAFFGVLGVLQLIQGKSLKKVDGDIYALGITYVAMLGFYALFEKVIVNYRPIIVDVEEGIEASYPSSHTMLVIVIMGTALIEVANRIKDEKVSAIIRIVMALVIVLMVVGRLLSGVHWISDIVGGMILGASLISFFFFLESIFGDSKEK